MKPKGRLTVRVNKLFGSSLYVFDVYDTKRILTGPIILNVEITDKKTIKDILTCKIESVSFEDFELGSRHSDPVVFKLTAEDLLSEDARYVLTAYFKGALE